MCTAIITCVFFCRYPSSRADNPTTLAQQNADSKTEFQSPYWNLVSDQAKSFVQRIIVLDYFHYRTAQEALRDPWYISTTTTTDLPSHVDLSSTLITGVLEQSGTIPISGLPPTRATLLLLLLRVARARKAVVDGITKIRVHTSSLKHRWRRRGRGRVILVEAILCLVFLNLLIKNRRFLGQR